MTHLLSTLLNWLSLHWREVVALVSSSAALSVGLETFLNSAKVKSKKIAYTLIHVLGIVTAVATYFIANLPTTDVPAVYGSLVILAQTWHRFVVSPAYNKFLVPYLNYVANQQTAKVVAPPPIEAAVSLPETESNFETS